MQEFCSNTSIHGFAQIQRFRNSTAKLLWAIFVTIALIFVMLHLTDICLSYAEFGYMEKMEYTYDLFFPDVEFCSLSVGYGRVHPFQK